MKLALLGGNVCYSVSPQIHKFIADRTGKKLTYELVSASEENFDAAVKKLLEEYDGFNVTIPYKLRVMPKLDKIAGDAKIFGAVNTVRCADRSGHNTDGAGFALMLKNNGVDVSGKRAVVIGAGGAGRSAAKKLKDCGAEVIIYSRTYERAAKVAVEFGCAAAESLKGLTCYAAVNASGVGMRDTVGQSPADESFLRGCRVAVDLIYNPRETEFLRLARENGNKTVNGLGMLFYQAYLAQCVWFGEESDEDFALEMFKEYV